MDSKASWCSAVQFGKCFWASFVVKGVNTVVWSASFGKKVATYLTSPRKDWTSVEHLGTGQFRILSTFEELSSMPHAEIWCLKKSISKRKNAHFAGFRCNLALAKAFITISMCLVCSATVLDQMTMSSK